MSDKKKGVGRGRNPNSTKNLKPIQPGEVRNPEGGRTHDAHKKELKKMSSTYLQEVIDAAFMGDIKELERMSKPESGLPAIQVGVARVLYSAITKGEWGVIDKVLERAIGKTPDKIDATSGGQPLAGGPGVPFIVEFVKAKTSTRK